MATTYSLVSELERLANALSSASDEESVDVPIASVAERIAKSLGVKNEEVAHPGTFHALETSLFYGAPSAEERGLHSAVQQFGAGGAHGARQSRGNREQFCRRASRQRL